MDLHERHFWRTELRDGFRAIGHCCRIESHATCIGVPDVNLQIKFGPEWWIEVKAAIGTSRVKIRPAQWQWHLQRRDNGGLRMFLTKWVFDPAKPPVYLVNIKGPFMVDDLKQWHRCADLVMVGKIDWDRLRGLLNDG